MIKDSLLEIIADERMSEALEKSLKTNLCYIDSNKELCKQLRKLDEIKLNKKQRLIIDEIFSAYNFKSSEYGRGAYQQGFKDGIMLMLELNLLKNNI